MTPEMVATTDAWYWAFYNRIRLQSGSFVVKGHAYQVEIMQSTARRRAYRKAAQMGFTEIEVLRTLHGMIHGCYPSGVLYLFPSADDVQEFSKARFNSLISDNPKSIGRYVKNTDAASIKRIGSSMLYLRGARSTQKIEGVKKDAAKLRSIPVDKVVFDERDLMEHEMVSMALERFSHSSVQEAVYLSTPSIPDYGIDHEYQISDQRIWVIKCQKCDRDCCLEVDFPACVKRDRGGRYYRACVKCGAELDPNAGQWVPQFPGRDVAGWWISQLNSAFVDPGVILNLYENPPNGNLAEVMNSKLGMAYIAAENRMTVNDIYSSCGLHRIADDEPKYFTGMGVDVGSLLHIVIGRRINGRKRILYVGRVNEFSDLVELGEKFHVQRCVIDLYPETRKVRELQADAGFDVIGCQYQDQMKDGERLDAVAGVVTVARTEMCDATHHAVLHGEYEFPRRCPEIEEYAKEMCATVKVLEEDLKRGVRIYRYKKLGADHYRHATNYFEVAMNGVSDRMVNPVEDFMARSHEAARETYGNASSMSLYGYNRNTGRLQGEQDREYNPLVFGLGDNR